METYDVYSMFEYEDVNSNNTPRKLNEIYNPYVPPGNQCTVDDHTRNVRYAITRINSDKEFRCDYHSCDTADFMAMCNEMHINCDNQCYLDNTHNETLMEYHLKNIDDKHTGFSDWLWFKLFGCKPYLPWGYTDLPRKTRYFMISNGLKKEFHEYLGLTFEQIKSVERFKRDWHLID